MQDKATFRAIAAVIVAGCSLAAMDAVAKYMLNVYSPVQIIWARFFFHFLLMWLLLSKGGDWQFFKTSKPVSQLIRSLLLLNVTAGLYYAIQTISLAEATAILFFAPVLVTLLAVFLGESLLPVYLIAVIIGVIGMLFVVNPTYREFDIAFLYAGGAAISLAVYFIMTRYLRHYDSERTTLFYTTLVGAIAMTVFLPWHWLQPDIKGFLIMMIIGMLGALGHYMIVIAFHRAPAQVLSPYLNAQLIAASIYSWYFFEEQIELNFYIGASLIVGAGLLVWRTEAKKKKELRLKPQ